MEEHLSSKKICFLRYSLKMVSFKILYFVLSKHSIEHLKTKQNKNKKTSDCNWTQNQNHLVHKRIFKKKTKKQMDVADVIFWDKIKQEVVPYIRSHLWGMQQLI